MGFVKFVKHDSFDKKVAVLREDIERLEDTHVGKLSDTCVKIHLKDTSPIFVKESMDEVLTLIENDFTKHIREKRETLQERMDKPGYGEIADVIKAMKESKEWNAYIEELTKTHYQQIPVSNNPKLSEMPYPVSATPYEEAWHYIVSQEFPIEVLAHYSSVVPTGTHVSFKSYDDILDMKSRDPLWLTRILRQAKFDTDRDIRVYHDKPARKFIFLQEDILLKGTKDVALLQNRPDPYGRDKSEGEFTK